MTKAEQTVDIVNGGQFERVLRDIRRDAPRIFERFRRIAATAMTAGAGAVTEEDAVWFCAQYRAWW